MLALLSKLQIHTPIASVSCTLRSNGYGYGYEQLWALPIIAKFGSPNALKAATGSLSLRANALSKEPEHKDALEILRHMSLKALKEELGRLGIKYTDCFEKEELVRRLASAYDWSSKEKQIAVSDKAIMQLSMKRLKGTPLSPKEYILIPLTIGNQGPFDFLLDTGSSITIISPAVAYNRLQIQQDSGKVSYGIGGTGTPFYGTKAIKLPPVKIMGHICEHVDAVVMDLSRTGLDSTVAGLVGMNVLSQFDVEFDFLSQRLVFYASGAVGEDGYIIHRMQQLVTSSTSFGIPSVQVKLGKAPPQAAILDFGSSHNVSSINVALDSGLLTETLEAGAILGGHGIGGAQMMFYSAEMDVQILTENEGKPSLPLKFDKMKFAVGDLPAMVALGARVILGLSIFNQSRIIISMSTNTVYMQIASATAGGSENT
ncbi:hypothetical protein O6H91_Y016400 [Diphasiastrum complanatum]|nr:hypothetical protein O6H91_Y016400 [Diphasiastrum complanatum]